MGERAATEADKVRAGGGFPGLDGLRTLAVFLVILSHQYIWELGWVGVQLFFVLSGYLITGILYRARSSSLSTYLRIFYGRRVLRIFPLYYAYLAVVLVACIAGTLPPTVWKRLGYAALYLANHYPVQSDEGGRLLWHFWSLAVEEQFYLVWPFLIYFCPQQLLRPMLLTIACAGPLIRAFVNTRFGLPGYLMIAHFDAFALGALSALYPWTRHAARSVIACFLLSALGLWLLDHDVPWPGGMYGWHYIFGLSVFNVASALLIELLVRRQLLPGLFENKVVRYLGKVSYGIYIFHFPAQAAIERLARGVPTLGQLLLQVAATVAISAASYELFEVRFLVLKERWFPSRDATAPAPAANASLPKPTGAP